MTTDTALWAAIQAHTFDQPGAALPFSRRLARDNCWSQVFADGAIAEYRRFMYLVCTAGEMLTPSEEVDQVWHLHLIYTRDYWDSFCGQVLKRPIHHGPTEGGVAEGRKYRGCYETTLALYRQTFGCEPPVRYWPDAEQRFCPPKSDIIHLPKRQVFLCLAAAGAVLTLAACQPAPIVEDIRHHPVLFVGLIVLFLIVAAAARRPARGKKRRDDGSGCGSFGCGGGSDGGSCDGGSGCGSGCGGGGCGGGCGGD